MRRLAFALSLVSACSGSTATSPASTTSTASATHAATTGGAGGGGVGGASAGGAGASAGGGAGGSAARPTTPDPKFLPKPTGACPALATGTVTFAPAGVKPRPVEIWMDADAAKANDGPLVFFWHGMGGSPTEATYAVGPGPMKAILAAGGLVAALHADPAAGQFPWWLGMGGTRMDDLLVADEVIACASASVGLDVRRLHSIGFSAGAMQTEQFATYRSGYLASVVAYSGALLGTPSDEDPRNKYPAMLFFGGPTDQVLINFDDATHTYHDHLASEGHFSFLCDHGQGHTVPADGPAAAWTFLEDHPFGVAPEPYAGALPKTFPKYCALP
jgi:predicted esterase